MFRLLILRGSTLALRPAVVLLEGTLVAGGDVLVRVLPLAMIAVTISSVPVHLDYFRSSPSNPEYRQLGRIYVSGLTWMMLATLIVLLPILAVLPLDLGWLVVSATCATFLIEKLADEVSRALEFRKEFVKWFLVQALRSGWMFLPIAAAVSGLAYEESFLVCALLACAAFSVLFRLVTGLSWSLASAGLAPIRRKLVFLPGGILPALYRQGPRLAVAKLFPEYAHIFLAIAQLTQAISLIFNVTFVMRYRKIMARRTALFQRRLSPSMRRLLLPTGVVSLVYLLVPGLLNVEAIPHVGMGALLVPVMIADAVMFSILSMHLGHIQWLAGGRSAFLTYSACLGLAAALLGGVAVLDLIRYISVLSLPALTVTLGFVWLLVIMRMHFWMR